MGRDMGYSKLKIMKSAAGYYYLGREYTGEDGFVEPGSRESGYFKTREEAEKMLGMLEYLEAEED